MSPPLTHLLDTSVCSQPLKRRPSRKALARWDRTGAKAATSETCLGEIEWGLHKLDSARRWTGYREDVLPSLVVLPVDRETWSQFARMKARQEKLDQAVRDFDLLIAASAVQHHLTLATLDSSHFPLIEGLRWEDWSQ